MTTQSTDKPAEVLPDSTWRHWEELIRHVPDRVAELNAWMDEELDKLQHRHEQWITPSSLKKSLKRSRS
jgi:hypothetical protein